MTTGPTTQCDVCTHFLGGLGRPAGSGPACEAFPEGIPPEVRAGKVDHREPVTGDHDIQWESDGHPYPVDYLASA